MGMVTWPEFQQCCGCISLKTATIIIGCWTIIAQVLAALFYSAVLVLTITEHPEAEDMWAFGYTMIGIALLISVIHIAFGIFIIVARNKASYLRKIVWYMAALCVLNVLVAVIGFSIDSTVDDYVNAISILVDIYCILILRSAHLQLEGRLTNANTNNTDRQPVDEGSVVFHNTAFHSPPPYDEAIRYGAVYRCDFDLTLTPTREVANEDVRDDNAVNEHPAINAVPEEQPTASNPTTSNTQPMKDKAKEESVHIIYDEEQFNAINNSQVVLRSTSLNQNPS